MARPAPLPLPVDQIPTSIRRFCDPAAPGPARLMAARGMVPIKGGEQVMLLLQLSADLEHGFVSLEFQKWFAFNHTIALYLPPGNKLAGFLRHLESGHYDAESHSYFAGSS